MVKPTMGHAVGGARSRLQSGVAKPDEGTWSASVMVKTAVVWLVDGGGPVTMESVGATVSVTKVEVVVGPVSPEESVATTEMVWEPSPRSPEGTGQLQAPEGEALTVQSWTPPLVTVTVLPGGAVPVMVGVLVARSWPEVGEVTTGAVPSTVNVSDSEGPV